MANRHSAPDLFDGDLFRRTMRAVIEARRTSMHQAAKDARLSVATISRLNADRAPDVESFARLCHWMEIAPSLFFRNGEKNK